MLLFMLNYTAAIAACSFQPEIKPEHNTMHITLLRTGGFTGIPMTKTVDAAAMSAEEASRLRRIVDKAEFFRLPPVIAGKPQPDRFQYEIRIEMDGKQHSVTVDETAVPAHLRPLLDWVMAQGR